MGPIAKAEQPDKLAYSILLYQENPNNQSFPEIICNIIKQYPKHVQV